MDFRTHPKCTPEELKGQSEALRQTEIKLLRQLEDVRTSKSHIDMRIQRLTNEAAAVSCLPNEILSFIFRECMPALCESSWDDHVTSARYKLPFVIVASHVNRRFRQVAIGTPQLWAHIRYSVAMPLELLDAMLERSATCLLSLWLRDGNKWDVTIHHILDKILLHAGRLLRFHVIGFHASFISSTISALHLLVAPHLRALELGEFGNEMPIRNLSRAHGFMESCPALSSLTLSGISLVKCWPPLASLTHLDLYMPDRWESLSYENFAEALLATPLLTDLTVFCNVMPPPGGGIIPTIHLPGLLSLEVGFRHSNRYIPDIYSILDTPQLKKLDISFLPDAMDLRLPSFTDFIRTRGRSCYSALRSVTLNDMDFTHHLDVDFIRALPSVDEVCLLRSSEDEFLRILFEEDIDSNTPLWRDLCRLAVSEFDIDLLCRFISHRIDVKRPLKILQLISAGKKLHFTDHRIQWLKDRVQLGYLAFDD
jgi:F-box-like